MTLAKMKASGLVGAVIGAMVLAAPAHAQSAQNEDPQLAAASLADGESVRAIAMLKTALEQAPGDPALLINLGIAYAQSGSDAEARTAFEAAMSARESVELETANGTAIDSRRLARRALGMLDRGEFRPARSSRDQLTMRE